MTDDRTYASPTAFRRALTDRLNRLAEQGPWSLSALQRQFGYDRLLSRLYLVDDNWVVKVRQAHLCTWGGWDSNPRPRDYESPALTG